MALMPFCWFCHVTAQILLLNPIALRMAKTLLSFGHSECNRVKKYDLNCDNLNLFKHFLEIDFSDCTRCIYANFKDEMCFKLLI